MRRLTGHWSIITPSKKMGLQSRLMRLPIPSTQFDNINGLLNQCGCTEGAICFVAALILYPLTLIIKSLPLKGHFLPYLAISLAAAITGKICAHLFYHLKAWFLIRRSEKRLHASRIELLS